MSSTNRTAIKQRFGIVGDSPKLNAALDIAIQVAPTEVTTLVVGENGTGKDAFAGIIHQLSRRKHKPFIAINCGAIPEGTIDSELFGHEKGSFTSAYEARKGYFEEVNGGILFMDEIAELPLATQSRLLRILENGEYIRVGSSKVQKTDVRIVAATNKNLIEQIRAGKFREDLYFRLNTVTIPVPPLRERGTDIELLFRYFANEFGVRYGREAVQLDEQPKQMLYDYHWPGNVRELRNFVEKMSVLTQGSHIHTSDMQAHLPAHEGMLPVLLPGTRHQNNNAAPENDMLLKALFDIRSELNEVKRMLYAALAMQNSGYQDGTKALLPYREAAQPTAGIIQVQPASTEVRRIEPSLEENLSLERKEKDLIAKALQKYGHNRKKAAEELGISERTLYRKIKSYGLEK